MHRAFQRSAHNFSPSLFDLNNFLAYCSAKVWELPLNIANMCVSEPYG
jgi:hypothetical protein